MSAMPVYQNDHFCSDVITRNAHIYKNEVALVCAGRHLTWGELDEETNRIANALLDEGCSKGRKVCMLMPNSVESFLLFWGTIKAGAVIVPLNVMLDAATFARLATASDGDMLFADASTAALIDSVRTDLPHISAGRYFLFGASRAGWRSADNLFSDASTRNPVIKIEAGDSMTIIYTSGTTGTPKGIEHSHFGRLNYCYGFGAGLAINRYSVAICATPIYASGTWITMFPTMYCGGKVVLLPKFTPAAFLEAVAQEKGTHSFMVPAQYIAILQHSENQYDTSSLRALVSAGQSLSLTTRANLATRFPGSGIYEVYGMTEGFFTLALPQDWQRGKQGTVGKPGFLEDIRIIGIDDAELPVGEVGEIVAYGPGMMKGYYGRADLTAETVWTNSAGKTYLRSGDLGRLDDDGFLYVSGRKKDMIKSGGINIYAVDIEDVLMTHPAVREVAVIGLPHPRWSETPVATVILKTGNEISAEDLQLWVNERLAKYQRLSRIIYRDEFPRATYGKIQKEKLRAEYYEMFASGY